jgi:hypothetical protein
LLPFLWVFLPRLAALRAVAAGLVKVVGVVLLRVVREPFRLRPVRLRLRVVRLPPREAGAPAVL